jgi:CheY-like chemotaxis protein
MSKLAKRTYFVLVADDSEADRILLKAALGRTPSLKIIGEVATGTDVIAYLKGQGHFSDREKFPFPDLLLLDLKMPLQDGFEVLKWLRTKLFGNLTVVVVTASMQAEHIKRALDLGADLFQIKPRTNYEREAMTLALEEYLTRNHPAAVHEMSLAHAGEAHHAGARIY